MLDLGINTNNRKQKGRREYTSQLDLKSNDTIYLLRRRGFLIDAIDEYFTINPETYVNDCAYLSELLNKYDIGHLEGSNIIIDHTENSHKLKQLFESCEGYKEAEDWLIELSYSSFEEPYYEDIPVEKLDPGIAAFCKALNHCGIKTASSCDGNHHSLKNRLYVQFYSKCDAEWFLVIYSDVLKNICPLNWRFDWSSNLFVDYYKISMAETFDKLFSQAEYLYANARQLRNIKESSIKYVTDIYGNRVYKKIENISDCKSTQNIEKSISKRNICKFTIFLSVARPMLQDLPQK